MLSFDFVSLAEKIYLKKITKTDAKTHCLCFLLILKGNGLEILNV